MKPPSWSLFLVLCLPHLASPLISCEDACASCDDEEIPSVLREVHCSMCQECEGRSARQDTEIVFPPGCPLPPLCQPMLPYCPPPCPTPAPIKLTHKSTTTTTEMPMPRPTLGPTTKKNLPLPVIPCCMPMCPAPCYPWPLMQQQHTPQEVTVTETTTESAEVLRNYDYMYVGLEKPKMRNMRRLIPS